MNSSQHTSQNTVPGLEVRQAAAAKLTRVLAGAPFVPLDQGRLADGRDRALANRLVSVALRRHGQITALLDQYLKKSIPKRSGLLEAALRIGLGEIIFIDPGAAHAGVFLAVETIRRDRRGRPFSGLANAVLRNVARNSDLANTLPGSINDLLPDWLARRWTKFYGEKAVSAMAVALTEGAPLDMTGRGGAFPPPPGQRVLATTCRLLERDCRIEELPGFAAGNWWVQDLAAALPARLLDVAPGQRVADLCAAPGGKTAQLADAGGLVTAVENDAGRMARLESNLERLKLNADLVLGDASEYGVSASFDKVLADLPCSATGTFRRHPEVLWRQHQSDLAKNAGAQNKILANGARLTKVGGVLVLSTCSLEPEEGEELASGFLAENPDFHALPVRGEDLDNWVAPILDDGTVRTLPGMEVPGDAGGTLDGFFIARFGRHA
ncbi:MAG: MFS transporter [Alphaproteobacteria bacterium]|nr:MFS transporter [Alphaproteobacteria bacterium]